MVARRVELFDRGALALAFQPLHEASGFPGFPRDKGSAGQSGPFVVGRTETKIRQRGNVQRSRSRVYGGENGPVIRATANVSSARRFPTLSQSVTDSAGPGQFTGYFTLSSSQPQCPRTLRRLCAQRARRRTSTVQIREVLDQVVPNAS